MVPTTSLLCINPPSPRGLSFQGCPIMTPGGTKSHPLGTKSHPHSPTPRFHSAPRPITSVPTKRLGGHSTNNHQQKFGGQSTNLNQRLGHSKFNHRTFGSPSSLHHAAAGGAPNEGVFAHSINRHLGGDLHGYGSGSIEKMSHLSHYGLDDHHHGHISYHNVDDSHHGHGFDHHALGSYHHGGHTYPAYGAHKGHHGGYGGAFQYPAPALHHHIGHDDYSHYHHSSSYSQPTYTHW